MQAMIRRRRRGSFVGRLAEVDSFRANLKLSLDDEQRHFLFAVHGDAGVGKTSLLRHMLGVARDQQALCAYLDHPVFNVLSAMDAMAQQFASAGKPMSAFAERSAAYQKRRRELESDPEAPRGSGRALAEMALRIMKRTAEDIPLLGPAAGEVDTNALLDQTERLRAFLGSKLRGHDDMQLLLAPVDVLTSVFVADLQRLAAQQPVAVFFDTYERSAAVLDGWLLELVKGQHGDLPANLTITIAGQHGLDPNAWADYLGEVVQMPLNLFSEAEARDLLAQYNVTDERVVDVILGLSGRLPLLLAMLAEGNPADPAEVGDRTGDAVDRFLRWVDDERRRRAALLAALPRRVNEDVLGVLVGPDDARELFTWLRRQPFVSEARGACHYHDVARAPMLRQQRGQAPERWVEHHRLLAEANAHWRDQLRLPSDQRWNNDRWRDLHAEAIYHRLCAEGTTVLPDALSELVYAVDSARQRAGSWADMLHQAGCDAAVFEIEELGARLLGSGNVDDDPGLVRFFTVLLSLPWLTLFTRAKTLIRRANEYERQGLYQLAFADYDRSLQLQPNHAAALAWRGDAYRTTKQYKKAVVDLSMAVEIDPDYSWAIAQRGETHYQLGQYDDALVDFARAIEIDPMYSWAIAHRARTDHELGRYADALANFSHAIEIDPQYSWAIAWRGETRRRLAQYEDSLADFTRAIAIDPVDGWAIARRGDTYMRLERYEEAMADFSRAIEVDPEDDWEATDSRSEIYVRWRQYDEALTDIHRALELRPDANWPRFCRGVVHLCHRYTELAQTEMRMALKLAEAKLEREPRNLYTVFNIALYHTALGDVGAGRLMYEAGMRGSATDHNIGVALQDLRLLVDVIGVTREVGGLISLLESQSEPGVKGLSRL